MAVERETATERDFSVISVCQCPPRPIALCLLFLAAETGSRCRTSHWFTCCCDRSDSVDPAAVTFAFVFPLLPTSLAAEAVSGALSALLAHNTPTNHRSYHTLSALPASIPVFLLHYYDSPFATDTPPSARRAPPASRLAQAHDALAPAPCVPRRRTHRQYDLRPHPPATDDTQRAPFARHPRPCRTHLRQHQRRPFRTHHSRPRCSVVERPELAHVRRVHAERDEEEEQGVRAGPMGPLGRDPCAVRRRGGPAAADARGAQRCCGVEGRRREEVVGGLNLEVGSRGKRGYCYWWEERSVESMVNRFVQSDI